MKTVDKAVKSGYMEQSLGYPGPVADSMIDCLQNMLRSRKVTVSAVFEAHMFMTTWKALDSVAGVSVTFYENLMHTAATALSSLGLPWKLSDMITKETKGRDLDRLPEKELQKLVLNQSWHKATGLRRTIIGNLQANSLIRMKQGVLNNPSDFVEPIPPVPTDGNVRSGWGIEDAQISADPEPTFLHKRRLEDLRLKLELHDLGIELANTSASVLAVAHLYNATKQFGILTESWDLLDRAIEKHMSEIFNGSLPLSFDQICKRWSLRIGTPASAFAKDGRESAPSLSQMEKALNSLLKVPEIVNQLMEYLVEGSASEKLLHFVIRQRKDNRKTVVEEDPLSDLKNSVQSIMKTFDIDMVLLHQKCDEMLSLIREYCKIEVEGVKAANNGRYQFRRSIFTVIEIFSAIRKSRSLGSDRDEKMVAKIGFIMQQCIKQWSQPNVTEPLVLCEYNGDGKCPKKIEKALRRVLAEEETVGAEVKDGK